MHAGFALRLCGASLLLLTTHAVAAESALAPPDATLAARSSTGATATEYWDVTTWLESGDRFFARFLVTNRGPGVGTAAAVGHLVLADGEILPFKWGRRSNAWTLGPEGRSLDIAKATLALDGPAVVVEIANAKHGIDVRLEIARSGPLVTTGALQDGYAVDVAMPAPAWGHIRTRGVDARSVVGTGAVTHTWMELPESDLIRRRLDLLTREGDVAMYLSDLTLADGTRRSTAVVSRADRVWVRTDDLTLHFGSGTTIGGDSRYPLTREWETASSTLAAHVAVVRELVRLDPLDIIPQPFRMLVALGGRPQLVWADAKADLRMAPEGRQSTVRAHGNGIVVAAFAQPSSDHE